ncbi:MAG TPA: Tad domain-containing protein [Vicinamibacterales bacterium]|nr:Tad domain-containing protein [Vicinamibacterales bacterium]
MINRSRWTHAVADQRGAVLIQVAVALLALVALSAFVVDYGVMWASRGQAQTSADAGALAGAISLAFNSATDQDGARARAMAMARENRVWGQAPSITDADITFPTCPPDAPGLPDTCVKVDVFRNQARANGLPMFFGRLVGVDSQGVRATATAQIATGDTTDCLKPWAIIDRWDEYNAAGGEPDYPNGDPDFGPTSTFDRYSTGSGNTPANEPDLYAPPGPAGPGTGFRLPNDLGRQFAIKVDTNTTATVSSGWFRAIRLPRLDGQSGADVYRSNIESCGGLSSSFAGPNTQPCPANIGTGDAAYWATQGCFAIEPGNKTGPTRFGIETLIARDPGASWSASGIQNSAFDPPTSSPRVVPIGVLDIDNFLAQDPSGGNGVLRLVNIFGFFVEGMGDVNPATGAITLSNGGNSVIGRLMTVPAKGTGSGKLPANASFLRTIILVR